jgi:hypothetical protein
MLKGKLVRSRIFFLTLSLALSILCGINADARPLRCGQATEKVIEREEANLPGDPLRILSVKAAGKTINFNEKFAAGEDWLKGLTLRVKNISDKEIIYLHYDLDFPETTGTGLLMAYQWMLWQWPGIDDKARAPFSLAPGAEADITIDEKRYADIVRFINTRQQFAGLSRARLSFSLVIFADKTGYGVGGTTLRQDPNNPRRFVPSN